MLQEPSAYPHFMAAFMLIHVIIWLISKLWQGLEDTAPPKKRGRPIGLRYCFLIACSSAHIRTPEWSGRRPALSIFWSKHRSKKDLVRPTETPPPPIAPAVLKVWQFPHYNCLYLITIYDDSPPKRRWPTCRVFGGRTGTTGNVRRKRTKVRM